MSHYYKYWWAVFLFKLKIKIIKVHNEDDCKEKYIRDNINTATKLLK